MITTEQEIIDIWEAHGMHTVEDWYRAHILKTYDEETLNRLLHPTNLLHPNLFWRASLKYFGNDCVANTGNYNSHSKTLTDFKEKDIHESNLHNLSIAKSFCMLNYLYITYKNCLRKYEKLRICEIGVGFGCLPILGLSFMQFDRNKINYIGYDIDRFYWESNILKGNTFDLGDIHTLQKNNINCFYSSNTFQHICKEHQKEYFHQMGEILVDGGYAIIMLPTGGKSSSMYGQKIYHLGEGEFYQTVRDAGFATLSTFDFGVMSHISEMKTVFLQKI